MVPIMESIREMYGVALMYDLARFKEEQEQGNNIDGDEYANKRDNTS